MELTASSVLVVLGSVGLALLLGSGCAVARPFSRPPGAPVIDAAAPVLVVVTHAVADRSGRDAFDDYTWRVVDAMETGQFTGLVGFSVRKQILGAEVWTVSVWRDEASLAAFSRAPIHREAMARGSGAMSSVRMRKTEVPNHRIPLSWDEALELLETVPQGVR